VVALTEMRRRKAAFGFIVAVAALVSYLVLMIDGLAGGLRGEFASAIEAFDADAIAFASGSDTSVFRSELDESAVAAVENALGVRESARLTYLPADYVSGAGSLSSAGFLGFDPGTIGAPEVIRGRDLRPDETGALLADTGLLRQSGLDLGDTMTIHARGQDLDLEIVGEIEARALGWMPVGYAANEDLLALKYGAPSPDRPVASIVLLRGDGALDVRAPDIEVVNKEVAFDRIEGLADMEATMGAIRVIVYAIGAAVVGVFFYVLTLHKTAVIAMLKALGARNRFVLAQTAVQAVVVVALALVAAIPAALLTSDALTRFAPDAIPIQPEPGAYLLTALTVLATALVGVVFSVRSVVRIDPALALARQQ